MAILQAIRLSKKYRISGRDFYALRPTSLSFSRGLIAIKGKSGSGKSTLLNLLSGMENASSGKLYFRGKRLLKGKTLLGNRASIVFQHYNLIYGETVLSNVSLPLRMQGKKQKGLMDLLRGFGLEKLAHKKVDVLSGGEKQRVAICRAMATNPEILFADEPTGALDEANSALVMETLKHISADHLVIMVSHNAELIEKYADRVIEIEGGKVVADTTKEAKGKIPSPSARKRHGSSWIPHFALRNIRHNLGKDFMCLLAGIIGFSALILSLGFFFGATPALGETQGNSLSYGVAKVSRKTTMEVPGSTLLLVKQTRPDMEDLSPLLEQLPAIEIKDDYSYFFPASMPFEVGESTKEPCEFIPLEDITSSGMNHELLTRGEFPPNNGFDYALCNEEFFEKYGWDLLGQEIAVHSRSVISYEQKQYEVFIDASFRLVGAAKEFRFLNGPKVYYSYDGLKEQLESIELAEGIYVSELVEHADPDAAYASYDRLLYLSESKDIEALFSLIPETEERYGLSVTSNSFSVREAFLGLTEAFQTSLLLFVGIALIGLLLILGMAAYSTLSANKKESALFLVLGARKADVVGVYVTESWLLCELAFLLSLALSSPLADVLNQYLYGQFDVSSLIRIPFEMMYGLPWVLIWGGAILVGLLAALCSYLPLRLSWNVSLQEELRDE